MHLLVHGINAAIDNDSKFDNDNNLDPVKMIVAFATADYGADDNNEFGSNSTYDHFMENDKSFFIVKMCEEYKTTWAQDNLEHEDYIKFGLIYPLWKVGAEVTKDLIHQILLVYYDDDRVKKEMEGYIASVIVKGTPIKGKNSQIELNNSLIIVVY